MCVCLLMMAEHRPSMIDDAHLIRSPVPLQRRVPEGSHTHPPYPPSPSPRVLPSPLPPDSAGTSVPRVSRAPPPLAWVSSIYKPTLEIARGRMTRGAAWQAAYPEALGPAESSPSLNLAAPRRKRGIAAWRAVATGRARALGVAPAGLRTRCGPATK